MDNSFFIGGLISIVFICSTYYLFFIIPLYIDSHVASAKSRIIADSITWFIWYVPFSLTLLMVYQSQRILVSILLSIMLIFLIFAFFSSLYLLKIVKKYCKICNLNNDITNERYKHIEIWEICEDCLIKLKRKYNWYKKSNRKSEEYKHLQRLFSQVKS